ncbi:DinB family protein [Chitinophaga polysaccharea]|uniref:DinB family protein n=1 Tax=Chitinophaga TaxID=79328 RepID=UPI001455C1F1|nr:MULTISPECIES: DinB family protein [Chitinophaga]NLR56705.1 DinB family protein [Chitinophaga polysaccharea]NLU92933.1 DinB family protein [Chitinophaga sp. Ak27]
MYLNQHEIRSLIDKSFDNFVDFVNTLPDIRFTASPYGKWSAGQQLDHLTKSIRPVSSALAFPKLTLRYFGTTIIPSRSYEALVADYQRVLAGSFKAARAYQPGVIYPAQRPALLQGFLLQKNKLLDKLSGWSEKDLDKYRLPHPLLGKITIREMLYFIAYHNEHHLEKLKDQELQGHTWQNQLQQLIF